MSFFDRFDNPAFRELLRDQRLKDLLARREFRISEEYVQREFIGRAEDDEVQNLSLRFREGFGELSGQVRKRILPFAVPFSARLAIHGVEFNGMGKRVYLRLEDVRPFDLDWVTRRVVDKVPFLDYRDGLLVCDLKLVPRLDTLLAYRVGGAHLADFVTLRDLAFREGELVGRLGFVL
jgi:hypothetical protein